MSAGHVIGETGTLIAGHPFRALVGHDRGRWEHLYRLILLAVLIALVPLAHASPPDPTWTAGVYDNADLDEALAAVNTADALIEHDPLTDKAILVVTGGVLPFDVPTNALSGRSLGISVRAPPALFCFV